MSRRVVMTGATGFVGSAVCQALVSRNFEVTVVCRASSERSRLGPAGSKVSFCTYDGTVESLTPAFRQATVETVVHIASLFLATHTPRDVTALVESNVLFGAHLAEAACRGGCRRLLNVGTSWQHYRGADYNPVCLYAATKQAFLDILRFYEDAGGLRSITLELFDTYGPGDPRRKVVNILVEALGKGVELQMSPGEQRLNLIHIDDVVSGFLAALDELAAEMEGSRVYSLRAPETISLRELVALLERLSGQRIPVAWGARPYRDREVMVPCEGGLLLPGWSAKVGLEEGLGRILDGTIGAGRESRVP